MWVITTASGRETENAQARCVRNVLAAAAAEWWVEGWMGGWVGEGGRGVRRWGG